MLALEVRDLSKHYGSVLAVNGVSLEVPRGEVVGLIGPNGAGKTTTIRAILGLCRPDAGSIRIGGVVLGGVARSDRVGALVDSASAYPHLTGTDNLRAAGTALGLDRRRATEKAAALLDGLGLIDVAHRSVRTYSTGQLQRLGIALALVGDAPFVVLDEPVNGLDPDGIVFVRRLIRDLAGEGRSVLLSSHLLDEVEQACDRVVVLMHGAVVAQGRTSELLGGSRDLVIGFESVEDLSRAKAVLRAASFELEERDGRIVVPGRGAEGTTVAQVLAGDGLFPAELSAPPPRLEEAFFAITARSGADVES